MEHLDFSESEHFNKLWDSFLTNSDLKPKTKYPNGNYQHISAKTQDELKLDLFIFIFSNSSGLGKMGFRSRSTLIWLGNKNQALQPFSP